MAGRWIKKGIKKVAKEELKNTAIPKRRIDEGILEILDKKKAAKKQITDQRVRYIGKGKKRYRVETPEEKQRRLARPKPKKSRLKSKKRLHIYRKKR